MAIHKRNVVLICFAFLIPATESPCTNEACINSRKMTPSTSKSITWPVETTHSTLVNKLRTTPFQNTSVSVSNEQTTSSAVFTSETTSQQITSDFVVKSKDQQTNSGAGIAGGIVAAITVSILLLIVFLVVTRRIPAFFKKNAIKQQQQQNHNNYTGNQNVAFVVPSEEYIHNNNTNYNTLQSTRDQHYYQSIEDSQNEATGNEHHPYMTIYDSLKGRNLSSTAYTDKTTTCLEPGDITKLRGTYQEEKQYDYSICPPKCDTENPINNTNQVNEYAILDPNVTGFDRHLIENRDVQIYELAKPISNDPEVNNNCKDDDSQYMPSTENVYDHAHNNRHKHAFSKKYDTQSKDENYS